MIADPFRAFLGSYLEVAAIIEGFVVLGNLVGLGQVGIIVVLAVHLGELGNRAVQGLADLDREFHGFVIHDRQGAGQAQANGANLGIGFIAKGRRATAK